MPEDESGDAFDALDNATEEPSFGGDYADWWEPDDDDNDHGSELVGIIVELHSEPEEWTDPGEVPGTVRTVMSLGRGDHEESELFTPKQHKQLKNGLEGSDIGDLVKLEFTGYERNNGNLMNKYEVGVIPEEEWQELGGSGDIQDTWDEHVESDGISGDNRRTEPYSQTAAPSNGGGDNGSDSQPAEVQKLRDIVDVQNGSISVDKADKLLNDINEFDVDVEETALLAGLDVEDDTITR